MATPAPEPTTYDLVGVTACPTGIAHTFLAAEALTSKAKSMGLSMRVETQGQGGADNVLTADDIQGAKGIIIAADKNVELDRFCGKPVYSCSVTRGIKEPEELISIIMDGRAPIHGEAPKANADAPVAQKEGAGRQIYKHLMNGVSHMLPFVVGGGRSSRSRRRLCRRLARQAGLYLRLSDHRYGCRSPGFPGLWRLSGRLARRLPCRLPGAGS